MKIVMNVVEHSEEINAMIAAMPSNRDQFEELVTLLKNRGQVKVEKKWKALKTGAWATTRMLPQNFLTGIEYFMTIEDEVLDDANDDDRRSPKEATWSGWRNL